MTKAGSTVVAWAEDNGPGGLRAVSTLSHDSRESFPLNITEVSHSEEAGRKRVTNTGDINREVEHPTFSSRQVATADHSRIAVTQEQQHLTLFGLVANGSFVGAKSLVRSVVGQTLDRDFRLLEGLCL